MVFLGQRAYSEPYVFLAGSREYANGDYAVIGASDVVVSTGNIFQELAADAVKKGKDRTAADYGEIGDYLVDGLHNRLFVWNGVPDESYSGVLVLRLSDRTYLDSISVSALWGGKVLLVDKAGNVLYTGYDDEDMAQTYVYDAKDYHDIYPEPLRSDLRSACLFGDDKIYQLGEIYQESDVIHKRFRLIGDLTPLQRTDISCADNVVVLYSREKSKYALEIWDLQTATRSVVIPLEGNTNDSLYQWQLTPDAKYLVYADRINPLGYHSAALIRTPHIKVYSVSDGKMVASGDISKIIGETQSFDKFFMGFSVSGQEMVFYSENMLYVLDVKTLKLQHKVRIPDAPDKVIWP